eukprot:CAMPEP_0169481406 /NCGR_PEP_ID=MMETSP1042-20121227/30098_1 /TAXON_ID=464988 /ORGANISM="Hemiselmis andersenii, Strain CCMP1180" /LENGTH=154 /DNA_ID=CAMNT_0009596151 /DNA_START=75 /DNA_END=536 /DNA_ORIENTATION=-
MSGRQPKCFGDGKAVFIERNVWDPSVPEDVKKRLQGSGKGIIQGPSNRVAVQPIPPDAKHPAAGQWGLVAAANLFPGEHVIDYVGRVSTMDAAEPDSEYVAELCPGIVIDAAREGGQARFINDFHGTGKMPNVRFERRVEASGEHRLGVHVMKR